MADYLQDLLARMTYPTDVNNPYESQPGARPGSWFDEWTKKKKKSFEDMPPPETPPLPAWGQQAGILTPGIGQLGNMNTGVTTAPVGPTDPNYADPNTPPVFPTPPQRQMMALVNKDLGPSAPLPKPGPERDEAGLPMVQREVDGTKVVQPPTPTTTPPGPTGQTAVPTGAQPTQGQSPEFMQRAGMLGGLGDFGNRIMQGLGQHSNLLLAMGAGLMGAPNVWQGLGRGFAYAGPAAQQDISQQNMLAGQNSTLNALITAGVPRDLAIAGATNPKIMDKLMETYVTGNKYTIHNAEHTNAWGEKTTTPIAVDERDPTNAYYIETGQPVHPGTSTSGPKVGTIVQGPNGQPVAVPQPPSGGGGGGGPPGQPPSQFYAPGVDENNVDLTKVGKPFLDQFSPMVQAAIMDRVQGLQPAGRGGLGGGKAQQYINMAAEKYGRDIGMPMDAASIAQRTKYATDLTSESASTAGGKKRALQQGLGHFAQLSDAMLDLHLSGGLGLEPLAHVQNKIRSLTTAQQDKIARAQALGDRLAGEMGQLTSTAGGSKGEREKTAQLVSDAFGSGRKAAGALEGIVDILQGGIDALESQRNDLYPQGNAPKGANFIGPVQEAQIDHIKTVIAKLRGQRVTPAETAPAATTVPRAKGNFDYDPATGTFQQR